MSRKVKCLYCGKDIDRELESFKKIKARYAHLECVENRNKKEDLWKNKLNSFICELFSTEFVPPLVQKQIKGYVESNMTYKGIYYSLWYFYKSKKNTVKKNTIGIVPYIYKEANDYYNRITEETNKEKDKNKDSLKKDIEVVHLEISPKKPTMKPKRYFKMPDDEELY